MVALGGGGKCGLSKSKKRKFTIPPLSPHFLQYGNEHARVIDLNHLENGANFKFALNKMAFLEIL